MQTFLRLALVIPFFSAAPAVADQVWTTANIDAVADAAAEATVDTKGTGAFQLVELADALISAGNNDPAKRVLAKASSYLGSSANLSNSNTRGNIIERFAKLGNVADAEALAAVDTQPDVKAILLGKFGAGRARTGDVAAARNAAKAVTSIAEANAATNAAIAAATQNSLAGIGIALSESGAPDEALYLAEGLPDGPAKLRVLVQVAHKLCSAGPRGANNQRLAQDISDKAANAARVALTAADTPLQQTTVVQSAAEAIAVCNGPVIAKTFVGQTATSDVAAQVFSKLADKFTDNGEFDLARAIAPPSDPTSAENLLESAKRQMKQGDRLAATRNALAASQLAIDVPRDPAARYGKWIDHTALLGRIFGVLAELGAYDDAIATVQPIEIQDRQHYYISVMRLAVQRKDAASIVRMLPLAIAAIRLPGGRAAASLYELTRVLAAGGYSAEARESYDSLLELSSSPSAKLLDRLRPGQFAALKADMGDMAGALSAADQAGPMVAKPDGMQILALAAMQLGGATKKPTEAEVLAALQRAREALPPLMSGPKAAALSAIAIEMAAQGNIEAALQVAAELDVEPRDVLRPSYDQILAAIAKAQERAGDLRGSLSTVLKIAEPQRRWEPLLKLAARPAAP